MNDLRHEALNRQAMMAAAMEGRSPSQSPPMAGSVYSATSDDDDDSFTPVHTRPSTPIHTRPSTPAPGTLRAKGSPSRTGTPAGSRSSSPSRLAKRRLAEEQENRASRDLLRRFQNEISSRIFRELDVTALARCLRVSKRWHRSATISKLVLSIIIEFWVCLPFFKRWSSHRLVLVSSISRTTDRGSFSCGTHLDTP